MSHGGALGMFQFVPLLGTWVDVTLGKNQGYRRFVLSYSKDMYTWNIPVE